MIMVEQFSISLYDDEQKQVRAAMWEFVQNGISDAGNNLLFFISIIFHTIIKSKTQFVGTSWQISQDTV